MLSYNMNTFMLSSWFTNNLLLVRKYAISVFIYFYKYGVLITVAFRKEP